MNVGRQQDLFTPNAKLETPSTVSSKECRIVAVGKRRDGGTRYWCLHHMADATAKYGKPAANCRVSHIPPIAPGDMLTLNLDKYKGGIALWGAVPAVYDTTRLPMDRGIHVHARATLNSKKEMDQTFRAVRILSARLPSDGVLVSELDAIYFMVSSIFGFEMKQVTCTYCSHSHLDRDWFSVHPHRRHLCAGCGRNFLDTEMAIGNPIEGVRRMCGLEMPRPRLSTKRLSIKQADFPGGVQIWGSNPAFLWTSERREEQGIHVHAFTGNQSEPTSDETYGEVVIDGVSLDASMVRVLMAQNTLPSLKNRLLSIDCPSCGKPHSSVGELAFTPTAKHKCKHCNKEFTPPGRFRKTIANPLLGILAKLTERAPREPQKQDLDLIPETL